jgi:hypothetical protein
MWRRCGETVAASGALPTPRRPTMPQHGVISNTDHRASAQGLFGQLRKPHCVVIPPDAREGTPVTIYEQLLAEWAARRAAISPVAADLVTLARVRDGLRALP